MKSRTKIALDYPNKSGKYFSIRVKQQMNNEPCEYEMPPRVLAISDIEGNFMALLHVLLINKVIDKYLKWTFGEGHLVVVGDCFDRGKQVVECLWLIYSLEEKARKKGGYVHFILGNHEIMNMNGDWRYVHPKYAASPRLPFTALYNGNYELWRWLTTKNIIEKIGYTLFVHGGIAYGLLKSNLSLNDINRQARTYYDRVQEAFMDPMLHIIFNSEESPFWYRGYYQGTASEEQVDATLQHFKVKRIVTGHTVMDEVTSFFNGKVVNVDTDHAGGNSQSLLITKKSWYRINNEGKKERLN